jgi:hypothetical protein
MGYKVPHPFIKGDRMKIVADMYYTTDELADHWKIKAETLEFWRTTNRYPLLEFKRIGGAVRYRGSVILAFEAQEPSKVKANTSYVPKNPKPKNPRPRRNPGPSRRARKA